MAIKEKLDYNKEQQLLKKEGPKRLYLLYGEETYLLEAFVEQLRDICVGDSEESFNYRRINGEAMELSELAEAVDAMPFFAERTFIVVRGYDLNKCREKAAEQLKTILSDIPDYCTLVFIMPVEPDGRLALIKSVKKLGHAICFTQQEVPTLARWIDKRFAAEGKRIDRDTAEYLIFCAGGFMTPLVSEIRKLSTGVPGDTITRQDIDTMVQRIPEASVFEMTDALGSGRLNDAAARLGEALATREEPIKLLALIGMQMRRIYAVKLAEKQHLGRGEAAELAGFTSDFQLKKTQDSAKNYTLDQLRRILTLCADYDLKMKSTGLDGGDLLRQFFGEMAAMKKC